MSSTGIEEMWRNGETRWRIWRVKYHGAAYHQAAYGVSAHLSESRNAVKAGYQ